MIAGLDRSSLKLLPAHSHFAWKQKYKAVRIANEKGKSLGLGWVGLGWVGNCHPQNARLKHTLVGQQPEERTCGAAACHRSEADSQRSFTVAARAQGGGDWSSVTKLLPATTPSALNCKLDRPHSQPPSPPQQLKLLQQLELRPGYKNLRIQSRLRQRLQLMLQLLRLRPRRLPQ